MTYFLAFIYCGSICAITQYILEKTKLTSGHMNTCLVIVGAILSGFGIYDELIKIFHAGAVVPIMNFGHLLVSGACDGYLEYGFFGLFKGIFLYAGAGISITIFVAFLISLFFKVRH